MGILTPNDIDGIQRLTAFMVFMLVFYLEIFGIGFIIYVLYEGAKILHKIFKKLERWL